MQIFDTTSTSSNDSSHLLNSSTISQWPATDTEPLVPIPHRTSSRNTQPLLYLRDYHCNLMQSKVRLHSKFSYPLQAYISYDSLSPSYRNLVLNVSSQYEPQSFRQAAHLAHWQAAMKDEFDTLKANQTWLIVPLPPGKQSIACRWVYKIKLQRMGPLTDTRPYCRQKIYPRGGHQFL